MKVLKFYIKHFREIWRGEIELLWNPPHVRTDLIVEGCKKEGIEAWLITPQVLAVRRYPEK